MAKPTAVAVRKGARAPGKGARLQPYAEDAHDSGVAAYRSGGDSIVIQFRDGRTYLYDGTKPGRVRVEAMKALAANGRGLTTYINRHVRADYARRLR